MPPSPCELRGGCEKCYRVECSTSSVVRELALIEIRRVRNVSPSVVTSRGATERKGRRRPGGRKYHGKYLLLYVKSVNKIN